MSKTSSSSAFKLLSLGGSNFNTASSKRGHELFNGRTASTRDESNKRRKTHDAAEVKPVSQQALPAGLDFFGSSTTSTNAQASSSKNKLTNVSGTKSKAQQHADSDSEDEDDEDETHSDSDESISEPLPAPPQQKIKVTGPAPLPDSLTSFDDLASLDSVNPHLVRVRRNMDKHGYRSMWGVQGAVSGALLATGEGERERDVMVVAPTGSGKTLAYMLPLFVKLEQPSRAFRRKTAEDGSLASGKKKKQAKQDSAVRGIRSLIVLPTHELALQTQEEILKLGQGSHWRTILLEKATEKAVCEAVQPGSEAPAIDFLVATPERLHHLLDNGELSLESVKFLVLDEADRLLGSDFLPQTAPIIDACTDANVQKVFLSATMESGPEALARTWLRDEGTRVVVGVKDSASVTIEQKLQFCGSEQGKLLAIRNDIAAGALPPPTLIFVQSIERANDLYRELVMDGLQVGVVHSERSKAKRVEAVEDFRHGRTWMLVVTDVMSRGLDFKGVEVVVNYDMPQTIQSYVHRIGRTGRGGSKGKAITYFTLEDGPYLRTIANVMRSSGCNVEPWMLELPKPSKNLRKERRKRPVERKDVGGKSQDFARQSAKKKREMIEASKRRKTAKGNGDGKEGAVSGERQSKQQMGNASGAGDASELVDLDE